jgi:hypothetical protein
MAPNSRIADIFNLKLKNKMENLDLIIISAVVLCFLYFCSTTKAFETAKCKNADCQQITW